MPRLMKLLALMMLVVWIFVACQSAEQDVAVAVATDPPPATNTVAATDLPPTAVAEEVAEVPTDAPESEPEVAVVEDPDPAPEQAAREPVDLGGYTNVVYTESDATLLGKTGKPQLLNVFAHW
ncbi:MAG: hypothetical protein ACPG8W_08575 [Candidatus Promineifilaceae bacterium]